MTATTGSQVVTHVDFGGQLQQTQRVRMGEEPHPSRHNFDQIIDPDTGQLIRARVNDEIVEQNRTKVPLVIRRHEWCLWCDTERIHFINVIMWERAGGYNYKGRPKGMIRMSRQDFTKRRFLETTNLPATIKAKLEKVGIRTE